MARLDDGGETFVDPGGRSKADVTVTRQQRRKIAAAALQILLVTTDGSAKARFTCQAQKALGSRSSLAQRLCHTPLKEK